MGNYKDLLKQITVLWHVRLALTSLTTFMRQTTFLMFVDTASTWQKTGYMELIDLKKNYLRKTIVFVVRASV